MTDQTNSTTAASPQAGSPAPDGAAPDGAATVVVRGEELQRFTAQALMAVGMREDDAQEMAGQIVGSELAGHESHGMRRLPEYIRQAQSGGTDPAAVPVVDLDRGALARIDGQRGFGHLVVRQATQRAIERAKVDGIAAVSVHNSAYAGRLSHFCEDAAEQGVATLVFVNTGGAHRTVAVPGGTEARFSTNPIAAGFPRSQAPHFVFDIATSVVAMGRLSEWRDRGEEIPEEWVTPAGLLQPFGGHKGLGLAMVAEALAGALSTAGTPSEKEEDDEQGVLIIAIDVAGLRPLEEFTEETDTFLRFIADTPVAEGWERTRIPGESSAATTAIRSREGTPVQRHAWESAQRLAQELGIDPLTAAEG